MPLLSLLLLSAFCFSGLHAQDRAFINKNYTKAVYDIKMRDGVKLHTIVYSPKDQSEAYPILMRRTPYSIGPYGERISSRLTPNEKLLKDKYIFVFQDVRGKYMSEGEYVNMRPVLTEYESRKSIDETTDTWDTVDWLIKNISNNNGKAGQYGVSYPGFYAVMGSINAHPAMVCTSPQAPISDWFLWDDMHHNGAFTFAMSFNFFQSFGQERKKPTTDRAGRLDYPCADAYTFFLDIGPVKNINENYLHGTIDFWNKFTEHPNYDDFWQSRSTLRHLKNITPAVLTVGGWYDGEDLSGALHTYGEIEKNNPDAANRIVMGPWTHGAWSAPEYNNPSLIPFKEEDEFFYMNEIEYPFFSYYLKGKGKMDLPDAWMFETGTDTWRAYDTWPPENLTVKQIFLQDNNTLSFTPPVENRTQPDENRTQSDENRTQSDENRHQPGLDNSDSVLEKIRYDEFVSDPYNPVPYTAKFLSCRNFYNRQYLSEDQRFAATRPDVLVYKGETLEDDMTVVGPVEVELYVSTTGTDADWVVKLIDVYPDTADNRGLSTRDIYVGGYQMLVRGDIFRGKYRNSFEFPEPFKPGEPTKVSFTLPDLNHCFKKGHHVMVQIQSSWFPLFDRNPQTFTDIYNCDEDAFQQATHRVYHSPEYPTNLKVNVL